MRRRPRRRRQCGADTAVRPPLIPFLTRLPRGPRYSLSLALPHERGARAYIVRIDALGFEPLARQLLQDFFPQLLRLAEELLIFDEPAIQLQ